MDMRGDARWRRKRLTGGGWLRWLLLPAGPCVDIDGRADAVRGGASPGTQTQHTSLGFLYELVC